jgi:hypothetical protein
MVGAAVGVSVLEVLLAASVAPEAVVVEVFAASVEPAVTFAKSAAAGVGTLADTGSATEAAVFVSEALRTVLLDKSTAVNPQALAASRLSPWATTPITGRRWSANALSKGAQSTTASTAAASMTTGSFSKKAPASAILFLSALTSALVSAC